MWPLTGTNLLVLKWDGMPESYVLNYSVLTLSVKKMLFGLMYLVSLLKINQSNRTCDI
jgi:hypothetical protein